MRGWLVAAASGMLILLVPLPAYADIGPLFVVVGGVFLLGEIGVVFFEAVVLGALLKLKWNKVLFASVAANLVSFAVGRVAEWQIEGAFESHVPRGEIVAGAPPQIEWFGLLLPLAFVIGLALTILIELPIFAFMLKKQAATRKILWKAALVNVLSVILLYGFIVVASLAAMAIGSLVAGAFGV